METFIREIEIERGLRVRERKRRERVLRRLKCIENITLKRVYVSVQCYGMVFVLKRALGTQSVL